ncbi:MAG TPA: thioredoxin domain-containing protein [Pyrinomonadaceae bacterium]|nr:thioredoxin domain-containing protein [Pyrinomonadaceae bacterium]
MRHFSKLFAILIPVVFCHGVGAQRLDDVLATSANATFTASSLSAQGQKAYLEQRKIIGEVRAELLSEMIANAVLELEAKQLNSTKEKLLAAQRAKAPQPTAAEIQKIYNANTAALGGRPLAEVRGQIVEYLKHDSEQSAVNAYIQGLRTKYKVALPRDVNAIGSAAADIIATVGGKNITLAEFEQANKIRLNDTDIEIFEEIRGDLEPAIFSALVAEEAKSRNLDTGSFIAAEITDKLRLYTDEERASIETALMRRLFEKYNVKINLREPAPIVQNILVEADDPQTGSTSAPVTVVMFTDFQCPACSRTHPVLKQTLAEYGNKIHFVVRDFPLESIHENAFQAALAANAARAQGKFFEYIEVLYRNQEALDKASLLKYAVELGLNAKQFELDFTDARAQAEVKKDQADGRSYGVGGTPAIFVNGVKVHRLSADAFRRAVDRALSK